MRPPEPAAAVTPRPAMTHAFGPIVLALLLGALTFAHPSATRIHTWPWALGAAAYWLAMLGLAAISLPSLPRTSLANRLVGAGFAGLVAATVMSAAVSPFAAISLPRIWPTLGGTALFFALHHWLSARAIDNRRSLRIARVLTLVSALLFVVSLLGWSRANWPLPWGTRNTVPFGHSNYTAGAAVLALPWCAWGAWTSRAGQRIAWMVVFAIGLLVLASTSSRGGALAFGLAAGAAVAIFLVRAKWPVRRKAALAVGLMFAGATVVLTNPRLRDLALERGWSDAARESNRQRSAMLGAGLELGRQRPLLGWGPGTVPLAYPMVRAQLDGGVDNVTQLHNTPVQIWATLGLAGLVSLAALCAGAGYALFATLREPAPRSEALAAAASLGGYAVFALTDHQFDIPIISGFAAANLALLTAGAGNESARPKPRRGWRIWIAALALGLLAIPLARDLRARQAYETALVDWENRRIAAAVAALDRAAAIAPADPYYLHQAAGLLLQQRDAERNPSARQQLTQAAIERLQASLRTAVHQEFAHFNLGWLALERERPLDAARHFAATARIVPDKGGVYFGLGLALHAAGDRRGAVRAFALEWVNAPLSISSPAWELSHLEAVRPAVRAEALRILAELRSEYVPASVGEAWIRWWLNEPYDAGALARGFSAATRSFALALPAITGGSPAAGQGSWAALYAAWREPNATARFQVAARGDAAFAAALQRRARHERQSFHAFLTAPTGDEPAFLRTYRRQRTGYGVLALHPDGPVLTDLYVVQENRVAEFAADLLPPKGWLPGRFLLALLPEPSAPQATSMTAGGHENLAILPGAKQP